MLTTNLRIAVCVMDDFTQFVGEAQRALARVAQLLQRAPKRPQRWRSPKPMKRRRETRVQYRYRMAKQYGGGI